MTDHPPSITDRRQAVSIGMPDKLPPLMRGAWLWAYTTHRTDEPTLTDWVNAATATWLDDPREADPAEVGADGGVVKPRMFWIDRDILDRITTLGGSRSAAIRSAVIAAVRHLMNLAATEGHVIEPYAGRLPNKVWR